MMKKIVILLISSFNLVMGQLGPTTGNFRNINPNGQPLVVGTDGTLICHVLFNSNSIVPTVVPFYVPACTFEIVGANSQNTIIYIQSYGPGTGPYVVFQSQEGTAANPTASQLNDPLGAFQFRGLDGANVTFTGASIEALATQNWTSTAHGEQIFFQTTPNNSSSPTQVFLLDQDGQIYEPHLQNVTSATSGAVCWTSSTGRITVDESNTCLVSSAKYKNSIVPLQESALTLINQLIPVQFNYNSNLGVLPGTRIGLIAEDVQKVIPSATLPQGTNPDKIDPMAIIATLVKAVQEQQIEIQALQTKANGVSALPLSTVLPNPIINYTPPNVPAFVPSTYNPFLTVPVDN